MAEVAAANGALASSTSSTTQNTLTSITALSRFEFELGKGNEGTKVLMIEWYDEVKSRSPGSWKVSWPGKTTVLPADEKVSDTSRRVYFLLPPNTPIPPHVVLSYTTGTEATGSNVQPQTLTINPLPAIFTPELGANAKASGKKGVLHTIWAKKRLQILEREIEEEREHNVEGIALEMALSERDWIDKNFGLSQKIPTLDLSSSPNHINGPISPSLQSPRSPGGRRFSDKLKGLNIGTSEKDLRVNTSIRESHPMSPEGSDVAYSSFSIFHKGESSSRPVANRKAFSPYSPPEHIRKQQTKSPTSSLDYVAHQNMDETDDGLFAKKLSPRTPDVTRSPFSFSSTEVTPISKIKDEQ